MSNSTTLLRNTWTRWLEAAGPWRGWSVCPTLLAPEAATVELREEPRPAAADIAAQLGSELEGGGVCVVLDLEPLLGVHVAARLNQLALAHAVLVLPRWPYRRGILPVDGLLHGLVSAARTLKTSGHRPNVALVLDAERNRPVPSRPRNDARADNRYRLSVSDLPDLASLRARGIRRLLKMSGV